MRRALLLFVFAVIALSIPSPALAQSQLKVKVKITQTTAPAGANTLVVVVVRNNADGVALGSQEMFLGNTAPNSALEYEVTVPLNSALKAGSFYRAEAYVGSRTGDLRNNYSGELSPLPIGAPVVTVQTTVTGRQIPTVSSGTAILLSSLILAIVTGVLLIWRWQRLRIIVRQLA